MNSYRVSTYSSIHAFYGLTFLSPPQTHNRAEMKKLEALNTEVDKMNQHAKEVEERHLSLRTKKKEVTKELEGLRAEVEASQRRCRHLLKEQEVIKEEEVEITGNRYTVNLNTHIKVYHLGNLFADKCPATTTEGKCKFPCMLGKAWSAFGCNLQTFWCSINPTTLLL